MRKPNRGTGCFSAGRPSFAERYSIRSGLSALNPFPPTALGESMYPLKAILIGNDESLLPIIRRELLNQNVEIDQEFADVAATIENLSLHYDENRLFVCHCDVDHQGDMIKRLSGAFRGRPIVALIEGESNSSSLVHAMRDGAAQVVMLPLDVMDFREAINMVALQFGHTASRSQVIAVTGAHGGVGSTTLALNLAYELAHSYQLETIVAELSLNFGVFSSYLAIEPEYTTLELLQHHADIDVYIIKKALVPFGDRMSVLAGPGHAVPAPDVKPATIARLIDGLRQLAQVVILDVPSTLDDAQLAALNAADEVVLVADHTVPSVHMSAEALRIGIRAHSPWVVVNRFESEIEGLDVGHIKDVLGIDSLRTITLDHDAVNGSINCGQPLRLCDPKSKALADIHALALDLVNIKQPVKPVKSTGLMSRFGHALGMS